MTTADVSPGTIRSQRMVQKQGVRSWRFRSWARYHSTTRFAKAPIRMPAAAVPDSSEQASFTRAGPPARRPDQGSDTPAVAGDPGPVKAFALLDTKPGTLISLTIGGLAGLASGLLGVGGGFLIVPLQVMWVRIPQRQASATSLAAILPIALVGAAVYYFGKSEPQIDLKVAVFLAVGSVVGAYAGAQASRRVPENVLKVLVAILLLVVGVKELHDALVGTSPRLTGSTGGNLQAVDYAWMTLLGLSIGILSGLTGVGGGIFLVPTMVIGFGIAQHVAQGTSLLAIVPSAAVGALTHYRHGTVDLGSAARISAAGIPAALLGAVLALWLPDRALLGSFGLFLLFAAYRTWPRRTISDAARN